MMHARFRRLQSLIRTVAVSLSAAALVISLGACGGEDEGGRGDQSGGRGGIPDMAAMGAGGASAAVPVQVEPVVRRAISQHLETNGVLEAENEVDLIARVAGPIVELRVEEGMQISKGQLLARIDERDYRMQVAVAEVGRSEALLAFERAQASWEQGLIAQESYDSARLALDTAEAQLESARITLDYTEIRAPFSGLVVTRYIKLAEHLSSGAALFRISDFNPLLCPIQAPERELARLRLGQRAHLEVEAYAGERFSASVLRISPIVDAATGTVKVTLEVASRGMLRPGMFASVYVETDTHDDALVIPRAALVRDSLGDTVFVKDGSTAARREVRLGFRQGDTLEVLEGLDEGDLVVVLGQDGLADGTPVEEFSAETTRVQVAEVGAASGPEPDQLEVIRQRMRERGLSDEEIEERLQRFRDRGGPPGGSGERAPGRAGEGGPPGGPGGGMPPWLADRIRNATPEELESIKERMRERGLSDEEIEKRIREVRGGGGE